MFPAEKEGEWEPYKVRRRQDNPAAEPEAQNGDAKTTSDGEEEEIAYEEDRVSEEGAVWPIQEGKVVNWSCFFALISHVYNTMNPPFHTPILLIAQPAWTPREHEKLTQFFFEKFKTPAFGLMDAALATSWAYGIHTATVVDVGKDKVDVTAVSEFIPHTQGRVIALPGCGGEALTQGLLTKLKSKGLNRDMCEQLKKNAICEMLPVGVPIPGTGDSGGQDGVTNPAAAASTGALGSGPAAASAIGNAPRGPGADTEVGDDLNAEDNEGVLDVASIVAGGRMEEYIAKIDKQKQEKAAATKKGAGALAAQAKVARMPNSKREKATFMYEDHALLDTLKGMNLGKQGMADAQAALDQGPQKKGQEAPEGGDGEPKSAVEAPEAGSATSRTGAIRREIEVGPERFMAGSGGVLDKIADAVHRTISSVTEVNKRSELWDSLIICGNGSRVRGMKPILVFCVEYITDRQQASKMLSYRLSKLDISSLLHQLPCSLRKYPPTSPHPQALVQIRRSPNSAFMAVPLRSTHSCSQQPLLKTRISCILA
jgi:actin-related protein 9